MKTITQFICVLLVICSFSWTYSQTDIAPCGDEATSKIKHYQWRFNKYSNYSDTIIEQCKEYDAARNFIVSGLSASNSDCKFLSEYQITANLLDAFAEKCKAYQYSSNKAYAKIDEAYTSAKNTVERGNFAYDLSEGKTMKEAAFFAWVLHVGMGEQDTMATNVMNKYLSTKKQLKEWTLENNMAKARSTVAPKEKYTGSDKATMKKKIMELFISECESCAAKYTVYKVYITADSWNRSKGERWDDRMKAYVQFDNSSLEVDIICVKKDNPTAEMAFLVQYNLLKNNISGKYSTDLLYTYIEDKLIEFSKVK